MNGRITQLLPDAAQIGERLLLTLWIGGMWAVGYLATPVLFNALDDRQLAGMLAGKLFSAINIIGLLAGVLLLLGVLWRSSQQRLANWRLWLLVVMLLFTALSQFGVTPVIIEIRTQDMTDPAVAAQFARWHGLSSVLYLINSLAGLTLVVFGLNGRRPTAG